MVMNLYLVCHTESEDDINMDLFVRCATAEEAVDLWRTHFAQWMPEGDDDEEELEELLPDHVFLVPTQGLGVLQWHEDVVSVGSRYHAIKAAKEALGVSDEA